MNLIHMTIIAGLMILLSLFIRRFFLDKISKRTFVTLWILVMFRLIFPFEISFGINLPVPFANNLATPQLEVPQTMINNTVSSPTSNFTSENMVLGIWIIGMVLMTLYFVVNHIKFLRHVNDSIPVENVHLLELVNKHQSKLKRKVQIRQSQKIVSPLTYGVINPVILIPKTFNLNQLNQLEYVFAHEYIHIKRFDCLIKTIATVVLCIHWFNPLVWVMYMLLQRDIELACDEKVLELFPEQAKSTYALTLIDLAEKQNKISPVYSYFSKHSGLEERIKMMAGKSKKSWIGAALAVLLVSGGTMVVFASETQDYPNTETPVEEVIEIENDSPNVDLYAVETNDDLASDEDIDIEALAAQYGVDLSLDDVDFFLVNEDGRIYVIESPFDVE